MRVYFLCLTDGDGEEPLKRYEHRLATSVRYPERTEHYLRCFTPISTSFWKRLLRAGGSSSGSNVPDRSMMNRSENSNTISILKN